MNEKMIKIDNIVKRYGSFVALDHLKLEIREGEIFGLFRSEWQWKDYYYQLSVGSFEI